MPSAVISSTPVAKVDRALRTESVANDVGLTEGPDGWIYISISDHILRIGR